MKKEIIFRSAFDERSKNPAENYGIHGVEMQWLLQGELGAVTFVVYTNWHLPHVQEELDSKTPSLRSPYLFHKPQPADVSYHSPVPLNDWQQEVGANDCIFLQGGECYCDGSCSYAMDVFELLLTGGSDAVWKELENYYVRTFGELR